MINVKNNSLFNENIKEEYLNTINEKTKNSYRRIFLITSDYENALNKDINQFTKEEMDTVLFGFKSKTRNTVETYARIISSYLYWCIDRGIIKNNIMSQMKPDDFSIYVQNDLKYFTEERLRRYEDLCNNYQDVIIMRLLFMGANGKELSEIRNIKNDDIDFVNERLRLINTLTKDNKGNPVKYTERYIDIDDRTISMIKGAMNQKIYLKRNGEISKNGNNIREFTDLVNNNYLIRSSITRTERFNLPVDKFVVYRRLSMIEEVLGIEKFNSKLIQQSGMLYMASQLREDGKVNLDDLKMIADRFNISSYHNLKGLITEENIKRLYPLGED